MSCDESTDAGSCCLKYSSGRKAFSVFAARNRAVRMRYLGCVVNGVLCK